MLLKIFLNRNTCLTVVNINQNFLIQLTKKIWQNGHKEIPIKEFVGLKLKMQSILSENNKKSNATKGVNISIEFNEYKDILLKKKQLIFFKVC